MTQTTIAAVGDRIVTVDVDRDAHDHGRILAIAGSEAEVAWDTGSRTIVPLTDVRPETRADQPCPACAAQADFVRATYGP